MRVLQPPSVAFPGNNILKTGVSQVQYRSGDSYTVTGVVLLATSEAVNTNHKYRKGP